LTLVASNFRYSPDHLEVSEDDLVKVTIRSEDIAYSFAIDEYRIVRRVPAGEMTTFEFRADRPGTFRFYSNLTSDSRHGEMQGELVVRAR
jgi:heme/copper-type cytochrome/quinol oxidase subunit 2